MGTVATISLQLEAQTALLRKGFSEANQSIRGFESRISGNIAAGLAKFNAILLVAKGALASVSGAVHAVADAMNRLDSTAKVAEKLGTSVAQLEGLRFAADKAGVSSGTLDMALQRMTRRISEAANGTGEAKGALEELGLSADLLEKAGPADAFAKIADAMQGVESPADRLRLAFKLFDSEGADLVRVLNLGSEGINAQIREFQRLGGTLEGGAEISQKAKDALTALNTAWKGFVERIAVAVLPALTRIFEVLADIVGFFNRLTGRTAEAGEGLNGLSEQEEKLHQATVAANKAQEEQQKLLKQAEESAKKAAEEIARRGESVARSLRTPLEIFRDSLTELNELVQAGAITWDIYERGVASAVKQLRTAKQTRDQLSSPAVAALSRTSGEAFSAVRKAIEDRRIEDRRHAEQLEELRAIRRTIEDSGVRVTEVRL